MTHLSTYQPSALHPQLRRLHARQEQGGAVQGQAVPLSAEPRMPSLLGMLCGIYMASVCTLSSASEDTAFIPQLIGVLLGICWFFVGLILKGQKIRWAAPITFYITYLFWTASGAAVTTDFDYFSRQWITLAKVVLLTWVVFQCVHTRKDFLVCCLLIGLASFAIVLVSMDDIQRAMAYSGRGTASKARVSGGLVSNSNELGVLGVLVIVSGAACLFGYKNIILRVIAIAIMVSGLYIVAASGSRTAMLGVLIGAVALYYFHFRKAGAGSIGKKLMITFLAIGFMAGTAYYVSNLPFFFRMVEVFSSTQNMRKEPRLEYFFRAMDATASAPLAGLGLGGFALAGLGRGEGGQGHYSHSTVSETLSTTGIPGFLIYYGGQFTLFWLILRTRKLPLNKQDHAAVNMIMAIFWVLISISVVAVLDMHRVLWPILGAACGYLINLRQEYAAYQTQAA